MQPVWLVLSFLQFVYAVSNPFDYTTSWQDPYDIIKDRFLVRLQARQNDNDDFVNLYALDFLAFSEHSVEFFISSPMEEFGLIMNEHCYDFMTASIGFIKTPIGYIEFSFDKVVVNCMHRVRPVHRPNNELKLSNVEMEDSIQFDNDHDRELWQTRGKFARNGQYTKNVKKFNSWFMKDNVQTISKCSSKQFDYGFKNWCGSVSCWYLFNYLYQLREIPKCRMLLVLGSDDKTNKNVELLNVMAPYTEPNFDDDVKVYRNDGHRIFGPTMIDLASGVLRVFHRPETGKTAATFQFGHGLGLGQPGYRFLVTDALEFSLTLHNDRSCNIIGQHNDTQFSFVTPNGAESINFFKDAMFILFFHRNIAVLVSSNEVVHLKIPFCNNTKLDMPITTLTVEANNNLDFVIYPNIVMIEQKNNSQNSDNNAPSPPNSNDSLVADDGGSNILTTENSKTPESREVYVSFGVFIGVITVEIIVLIATCIAAPLIRYKYDKRRENRNTIKAIASNHAPPPPSVFAPPKADVKEHEQSAEKVPDIGEPELGKNVSREMITSQHQGTITQNTVDQQAVPIDYTTLTRAWLLPQDFWVLFPLEQATGLQVLALEGDVRNESIFFFLRDVTQHEDAMFNHVESRLNESGSDYGAMPTIYREKDIPQTEFNLRDPFTVIRAFVIGHAPLHLELYFTGIVPYFVSQISPNCARCKNDANKSFLITDSIDLKTIVENLPHGYHFRVAISNHHDLSVTSKRTTVFAIRFGMPFDPPSVVHYASLYHRNTQNRKHIPSNKIIMYREALKTHVRVPGPTPSSISQGLQSKKSTDLNSVAFLPSASRDDMLPTAEPLPQED